MISVVIPTYNRAAWICEAIDSVLNQTEKKIELLIVDDGSTDDTQTRLHSYQDPRIKILRQENKGVSRARNYGISKANGSWIAFLDSDDYWLPHKLELQKKYLEQNPSVRICQTEEKWIRNGLFVNPMKKHKKYSGWIFNQCLPLCIVSPSAVMIHREVFDLCGLFDETLPACEDYDLWLRVSLAYPIMTLPEALIVKRGGHEDQLSRKFWGMDRFRVQALKKILDHPLLHSNQRILVEKSIQTRMAILAKGALKRGKKETTCLKDPVAENRMN